MKEVRAIVGEMEWQNPDLMISFFTRSLTHATLEVCGNFRSWRSVEGTTLFQSVVPFYVSETFIRNSKTHYKKQLSQNISQYTSFRRYKQRSVSFLLSRTHYLDICE